MSDKPTLYNTDISYYSMIARLVFAEKRVDFISKAMDIHVAMDHFKPAYLKINPNVSVPAMTYRDQSFASSEAILYFVAKHFDGPNLLAKTEAEKNLMDEFVRKHYQLPIEKLTLGKLCRHKLLHSKFYKMMSGELKLIDKYQQQAPELVEAYEKKRHVVEGRLKEFAWENVQITYQAAYPQVESFVRYMDACLQKHEYIVGEHYTIADVLATVMLARLYFIKDQSLYAYSDRLLAYWQRVRQRPSFAQAIICDHMPLKAVLRLLSKKLLAVFV